MQFLTDMKFSQVRLTAYAGSILIIDLKLSRVRLIVFAGSTLIWNLTEFVQHYTVDPYWVEIQPDSFNAIWWFLTDMKFSQVRSTAYAGSILIIDLKFSRNRTTPQWFLDGKLGTRCITNHAISWKLRQDKMFRSHWQRKFLMFFYSFDVFLF